MIRDKLTYTNVTYSELEYLAFDINTPAILAKQYQELLQFLKSYIPDKEYRINEIDKYKMLKKLSNGNIIYSEVE